MPDYTLDYFIQKFEAIPEDNWSVGYIGHDGYRCALGHCGVREVKDKSTLPERDKDYGWLMTEEAYALADVAFGGLIDKIWKLNDRAEDKGTTPKSRILNHLYSLKERTNG